MVATSKILGLLTIFISFLVVIVDAQTGLLNWEAEIQLQYTTSNWILRLPKSEAMQDFLVNTVTASEAVRQRVPHVLDTRYGVRQRQLLDIYSMDLPSGSPIVVFIHGGNWRLESVNKSNSAFPAIPLRQAGVMCIVAEYDLTPNGTCGSSVTRLELISLPPCWRPRRFNHLAPELKVLIRGFVLISGYYDLTPLIYTITNNYIQLDRRSAVSLSPMFNVNGVISIAPLTISVVISQQDSPAMHGQTHTFYKVIQSQRQTLVNAILFEVPGKESDHNSVATNLQYSSNILTKHIVSLIKNNLIV